MRIKNEDFLQDIIDGVKKYSYKMGSIFDPKGDIILPKDYTRHFGQRVMRVTPNAIKDIVATIQDCCVVEEEFDLWQLFFATQEQRFEGLNSTRLTPLLFTLYDDKIAHKLMNIAAAIVQGKQKYMFILHGVSGAGKSLFIDSIIALFGKTFQTVKQMTDFNGQFTLDGIQNKLLVQCNDLGQEQVTARASGRFKQICDGSEVNIERKGKREELVKPWFNLLFGCNVLPQFNALDAGNLTRGAYLHFDKSITLDDYHATRKELLSEQELCNLYNFCLTFEVQNDILKKLSNAWRAAQLKRYHMVFPKGVDTTYLGYQVKCDEYKFTPFNYEEFNDLKQILFANYSAMSLEEETQLTIDNEELPF